LFVFFCLARIALITSKPRSRAVQGGGKHDMATSVPIVAFHQENWTLNTLLIMFSGYASASYLAQGESKWSAWLWPDTVVGRADSFRTHIALASLLSILLVVQLSPGVRALGWQGWAHAVLGSATVLIGVALGVASALFTYQYGSHAGFWMDAAFLVYAAAMIVSSVATAATSPYAQASTSTATRRTHSRWGLLLGWLCAGSAVYRVMILPVYIDELLSDHWDVASELFPPQVSRAWMIGASWLIVPACALCAWGLPGKKHKTA
jgi:hypothetical protein